MQHLWSAATWELQVNADAVDDSMIAVPVTILSLDIREEYIESQAREPVYKVPLDMNLYLLTAWYVHDFLDKLRITLTDPNRIQLWYNEPKPKSKGISTRAVHIIPIGHLWYSVDGLYQFTFQFSNDDGYRSEAGSFRIVLNSTRRKKNV